ncbi:MULTISPECIES: YpfB family protein [Bacillaceae]|uniref:YpfB family protein n=1 Tax=Bacillaceae TaxID=186817 RepID=UPI0014048F9F|nr:MULTISPECIES: YpfB family protein [Bacillaceae]MDT2045633.1 YpfB family protein [Priestia flexa]USY54322.1 YpfB family protein [Bacillus sp. 1780r2a1]
MKRIENLLIKFVIVQFFFLFTAQALLFYSEHTTYFSKVIQYEGVAKNNFNKIIETFDQ